ncbi:amino acid adenylation domain-containing protein [Streptomyces tubbatahanensis]|uniref:Amino acid adenylation domain-containing protein n=2 Tax=Streptomyces tubbatahanensis TaxID=2923272 RepID=A0ABY3Y201_9ACTN|nr:amino acid adenylation domain-containing protein [Streptomyces tubbatahanensis]
MVPALVVVDRIPLTPNGKVDRRALPEPAAEVVAGRGPRSPREEILCGLFAEVLGVSRVGIDDSFFGLGGHSLLATRLVGRVRSVLDAELSVRELFEAPTVAALSHVLDAASSGRRPVVAGARPARLPLSFGQERLWFLHQLEGPSPTYNVPMALRLSGSLDREALRAALGDVVARHESLRTVFAEDTEGAHQVLLDPRTAVPEFVVRPCTEAETAHALAEAARHSFDLGRDVPLRAVLFEQTPDEHVLLLLLHHIACDGWSVRPLVRDLVAAYEARMTGDGGPRWSALPVQYADYALWQRELLGAEDDPESLVARQVAYWREQLADLPAEIVLPVDRPRPAAASHRGERVVFTVPAEVHAGVVRLARESRSSVFMVLQAALVLLLSRSGAGEDVPIGTPVAGRGDDAVDDLVGLFINTLVLRTDVSGDPTFRELVGRVRETDLEAYAHQDVPFERLVEILNPERSLSRHPLFQVMLTLNNIDAAADADPVQELPGLTVQPHSVATGVAKTDLTFAFAELRGAADGPHDGDGLPAAGPRGLHGVLEYHTDLFDEHTCVALAERLVRLLKTLTAAPDGRLHTYDVLTPAERHDVIRGWNDTARPVTATTVTAMFDACVAAAPDDPAVAFGATTLTYADLDRRAARLARLLTDRGVGPETFVGIALERSESWVVALLAVLKAGGAFMPLDPGYPDERIRFMLQDSAPELVITSEGLCERLGSTDAPLLIMDAPETADALTTGPGPARQAPPTETGPDSSAYVIYTSGSTGRPKGVVIPHGGLPSMVSTAIDRWGLGPGSRVLQMASTSFDASLWDVFGALLSGSTLVLAPADQALGEDLTRFVTVSGVTHMTLPPAVVASLTEEELPAGLVVTVTGDTCPPATARRWSVRHRLFNGYGPTETTVAATAGRCDPHQAAGSVPIGAPFHNKRVYVLDDRLRPVPPGTVGQLWIAGTGLARGYHGAPGLTAQRFVADPFADLFADTCDGLSAGPGARMYDTGDLARWRADGTLEFAGRRDDQVKFGGFRIELGEVESVLLRCPGVVQAAAAVREDQPGRRRLVGYAVPEPGTVLDTEALREFTAATLPGHAVPSAFVALDELPLSPNGKVDRAKLPRPRHITRAVPRDRREQLLCEIFAQVLGLESAGPDDRFFDLGGDSITSIQFVGRARAAGLDISPRDVFTHQTPAAIAGSARSRVLKAEDHTGDDGDGGPLPPTAVLRRFTELGGPVERFAQSRLVEIPPGSELGTLVATVTAVVRRHEALRLRLVGDSAEPALEVQDPHTVDITSVVRRVALTGTLDGISTRVAVEADAARSRLDPRAGRLVDVVWFDRGATEPGFVLLVIHHFAVDEVSWRILLPELTDTWNALSEGRAPEPRPVGTSLRSWVRAMYAMARSPERTAETDGWARLLSGPDHPLGSRPLDRGRDVGGTAQNLSLTLPPDIAQRVLSTVPAAFHAGVDDVLLTALALAVARWRGTDTGTGTGNGTGMELLVDVETHGRHEELLPGADLATTVGWFTDIHPVRLDLEGIDIDGALAAGQEAGQALKAVKEQLRSVPGDGFGYGLLRHLNPDTREVLAALPTPQIGFNNLGRSRGSAHPGGRGPNRTGGLGGLSGAGNLGGTDDPRIPLPHAIDLNIMVREDDSGPHLVAVWTWASGLFARHRMEELARAWFTALEALADHAAAPDAGGRTPSDLLGGGLSQTEIDALEAEWRNL